MMVEEVARAHSLHISAGKPVIVPVRIKLDPEVLLPYPLSAYINRFQYILWQSEGGTGLLVAQLNELLAGGGNKTVDGSTRTSRRQTAASFVGRNRSQLIRRVRHDWIDGVLRPSLAEFRDLSVGPQPSQPAAGFLIRRPGQPFSSPVNDTSIVTLFDEHVGQLLILGVAGVGKTTLLLKLLETLLDRAEHEPRLPVPVFLNLSSWAARRPSIESWLGEELREHYDVPRKAAEEWIKDDQILPILDGLDETDEHRLACVEAINSFRKDHGLLEIAIASRAAEYEVLATKLRLPGCVSIQRLGREQIRDLVGTFEISTRERLRLALLNDEGLCDLLDTPLMLKMAVGAMQGSAAQLPIVASVKEVREMIVGTYIETMLERRPSIAPRNPQLLRRMAWLAATMRRRNQHVFHLESLDLTWLKRGRQRWVAVAAFIVGCGSAFSAFGIPIGALLYLMELPEALSSGQLNILVWISAAPSLLGGVGGLLCGSLLVLNGDLDRFTAVDRWTWSPAAGIRFLAQVMSGVVIGTPNILVMEAVNRAFIPGPIAEFRSPNDGTWRSLRSGFVIGVLQPIALCLSLGLLALPLALFTDLNLRLAPIFDISLLLLLMPGLFGVEKGIGFFVRHWSVRLVLRWQKHATTSFSKFLDDAARTTMLREVGGGYIFVHRILQDYLAMMHDSDLA